MVAVNSDRFLTSRAWHRAVVGGKDMILRHTSALEHLGLFGGYIRDDRIEVYAIQRGEYENIDYTVVASFDEIDYTRFGNVLCTSVSQTINDMLDDFDNIDEQSLIEGLSRFYYTNGESFEGLYIAPENAELFNSVKDWAVDYYSQG
jgi:uncharacterized protein (DUF2126 family)